MNQIPYNQILYKDRCKCNKKSPSTKKQKVKSRSKGKPLEYPQSNEINSKIFQIRYPKSLSPTARFLLNSFQNKYIYYAIDDILYSLKSNPVERDNLLEILYSPILSLHNNFSVNFFDIWIGEILIDEISKSNRFLRKGKVKKFNSIRMKFFYKTKVPPKKQESLW